MICVELLPVCNEMGAGWYTRWYCKERHCYYHMQYLGYTKHETIAKTRAAGVKVGRDVIKYGYYMGA